MKKVLLVFGTRPEAIKMCPLIIALNNSHQFCVRVCLTGQHNEMLDAVMQCFNVEADYNLRIMSQSQTVSDITVSILKKIQPIYEKEKPDLVLVHGDTSTSFAAALAAFYFKIQVGHIEAGLRSYDIYSPFPEEINRQLTDRISSFRFAPTKLNADNLFKEGITENVFVTGNTVIDSFKYTVTSNYRFKEELLNQIEFSNKRVILVTAHRRENIPEGINDICEVINSITSKYSDVTFIFPVHPNPAVKNIVYSKLSNNKSVYLLGPLSVFDLHNLYSKIYLVMTDSGGIQEEAPHFSKPVIVLRNETERPEGVSSGVACIAGNKYTSIFKCVNKFLESDDVYSSFSHSENPYGEGDASEKISKIIMENLMLLRT